MGPEERLRKYIIKKYGEIMGSSNYNGELKLKDIDRKVLTPLDKYKPYFCPVEHTQYKITCPSCRAIYGVHDKAK